MKNKSKLISLFILLAAVVASGVLFLTRGTKLKTVGSPVSGTPSAVPTVTGNDDVFYTEKVVDEYDMDSPELQHLYNDNGRPLRFVDSGSDAQAARLVSLDTEQTVITFPLKPDWTNMANLCVDSGENLWICYYDKSKKQFFLQDYDKTGKKLGHTIYLPEFGFKPEYPRGSITKLAADDSFFYLYYGNDTASDHCLEVFDRSGKQVFRQDRVEMFDIDHTGNLYMELENEKNGVFQKFNVSTQRTVWSDENPQGAGGTCTCLWYIPSTKMIYKFSFLGVYRYVDNRETIPTEIKSVFKVGSDSSFTASEYSNKREEIMSDYAADAKGRLYFLAGIQTSDSKHQFPFYRGSLYQFIPEAVPQNISYAFTVTAPYKSNFLSDAVERYEHTHSGKYVKLDCAYDTQEEYEKSGTAYNQRLTTRILSNDVGDIVVLGSTNLPYGSTLRTDAFLDLTDRIKNDPNAKDLNQNVLNGMKQGGAIRALPVSVKYNVLQVNLTLMKKAGVDVTGSTLTWSRLFQIAKDWNDRKTENTLFEESRLAPDYFFRSMLISNLPDLVDTEKKTANLNQPWFLSLLKQYKSLENCTSFIRQPSQIQESDSRWIPLQKNVLLYSDFLDINTSFRPTYSYMFYEYTKQSGIEHAYIPMPCGEKNANREAGSVDLFAISGHSSKQAEAWNFLSFLLTPAVQQFNTLSGVPLNLSVEKKAIPSNRYASADETKYQQMVGPIYAGVDRMFYSTDVLAAMLSPLEQYVGGKLSLDDAVKQAQQSVERTLNA